MITKNQGGTGIEFVVWDLGDTLIRIRSSVWSQVASYFADESRIEITPDDLRKAVRQEWLARDDPTSMNIIRNIDTQEKEKKYFREFYLCVAQRLGLKRPSDKLIRFLVASQMEPCNYEIISGAKETLEILKKMQIPQALLSNGFVSSKMQLMYLGLDKYFELIMISFEEKLVKPDIAIYKELLTRLNVDSPKNVLFVDDRLTFVEGAARSGMQSVWFNNNNAESRTWKNTIFKLDQILDRVTKMSGADGHFFYMIYPESDALQLNMQRVLECQTVPVS